MVFEFICKDFETNGEVAKPKLSVAEKSLFKTFPPVKAFKTVHAARCSQEMRHNLGGGG